MVANLRGKFLLWAIFSDKSPQATQFLGDHVKAAYNNLCEEEMTVDPIEKQLLVITG